MMLTLTVLGGSAAWPNPGQGCSAYLVQDGSTSVLLDCGPNTLLELRKHVDYATLDAIVISHCHSDHILDLVPYRYGLIYGPVNAGKRIPVWLPPGGHERMELLGNAFDGQGEPHESFWDPAFDLMEYDPAAGLTIGSLQLAFALTQHYIPCYAMRIENSDARTLFYSSDTGSIQPLQELVKGAEVVIAEATLEQHDDRPEDARGHMTPGDAGRLATTAGAHTLIVTHLWSERPDDIVERTAAEHFDGRILIAKPGLRVDA
ncbi:MAG TPA: MBL fold metallo-hydrolase [Thermomicrobiales bacterium]|nr:MBL fold metallo-hydrolase [Thermomicrobiales bacterium]